MKRSLLVFLILLCSSTVYADNESVEAACPPDDDLTMEATRYLRALSLDIRGTLPSMEEYTLVESGRVPTSLIDEWLGSEDFVQRAVRYHRDLLWNNIRNVNLFNASAGLRRTRSDGSSPFRYWRTNPAVRYRGENVPCLDQEAEFDQFGTPVRYEQPDGTWREGYVEVTPYWDPTTTINACAFDAQDNELSPTGTQCATRDGLNDIGCGCGPDMSWCRYGSRNPLMDSFAQALEMRVADNMRRDASYLDLMTDNRAWVNGPLVHYWKHQTAMFANVRLIPEPLDTTQLPDLQYTDYDTWVEVRLPDSHSGIFTDPAFLLRFQTRRARAARFYDQFICSPFNAPAGGLPNESDQTPSLDLQVRDGCDYCHAILEPSGAHWGRWPENSAGFLDPARFPPERDDCLECAMYGIGCGDDCNRYYATDSLGAEEDPFLGMLDAYKFRRDPHKSNVEAGPRALVQAGVVDGRLPTCTAENAARFLIGRDLLDEELPWIEDVAVGFAGSDYSWREVVRSVVLSDAYRRVR
jgi:hypothetical protein